MARDGITFEQVAAAADALVGEGLQPAIRAVRERLGTGSPNTVHKHLVRWREVRPVASSAAPELPQALAAAISTEIERAVSQARATVEARLVQAQAEAADLAAAGELLEAERDTLTEQVTLLTSERDTLAGKAAQQAADLADQARRIEREQQAAEAARVDLATARLKLEAQAERQAEQKAEIERLRAALDDARQAGTEAKQEAAVLVARLEAASERVSRAEQRVELLEQQVAAAAVDAKSVLVELSDARKAAGDSREQAARLTGQLEAAERELISFRKRKAPVQPAPAPLATAAGQTGPDLLAG